jgi:hypothetical protein
MTNKQTNTFLTLPDMGRVRLLLILMALLVLPDAIMQAQHPSLSIASNTSNATPAEVTSSQTDDEQHAVLLLDNLCDQDRLINMSDPDQKYYVSSGTCVEFIVDTCWCPDPSNVCICTIEIYDDQSQLIEEWIWDCRYPNCQGGFTINCAAQDHTFGGPPPQPNGYYCLYFEEAGEYRFKADLCARTDVTIKCITCNNCKDPSL